MIIYYKEKWTDALTVFYKIFLKTIYKERKKSN